MPRSIPLQLSGEVGKPLHRQLEDALRRFILGGYLQRGERVPSIRELARQMHVAPATVAVAYEQLTAEGYLDPRVGSGTRVASELPDSWMVAHDTSRHLALSRSRGSASRIPAPIASIPQDPYVDRSVSPPPGELPYDFRRGRPGLDLFPTTLWDRLLRQAWRSLAASPRREGLDYGDPAGTRRFREAISNHLRSARGLRCSPDMIVATGGSHPAFDASARLLLGPGRACVVEDPGYPLARRAIGATGGTVIGVGVDDRGLVTDALPKDAAMAMVTPSWQYPLGGTMPVARRMELLQWAHEVGAVVVEDDYDSEFRYEGYPLVSLQGIDSDERVIYVGTLSKSIYPGLRLGFAVVPNRIYRPFVSALELGQRGTPILEQTVVAMFVEQGHFERHLRRMRLAYARRQEALLQALNSFLSGRISASAAPAGLHLVGVLEDQRLTATEVAQRAREHGVGVTSLLPHQVSKRPDDRILMNYTGLKEDEIEEGVRRLARVFAQP